MAYDQGMETDPEVTLQLMNRDSKITIINLLMDLKCEHRIMENLQTGNSRD